MEKIMILGTEYTLWVLDDENIDEEMTTHDFLDMIGNGDYGKTNIELKEIKIAIKRDDLGFNHILRHELIHAFLYESGLYTQALLEGSWASNEEIIDWFAIQYPKFKKVCDSLNI